MEVTKVKANNYSKAVLEMTALDKTVAKELPEFISEENRGHFVVAMVRQTNNAVEKRYDTNFNLQYFDPKAFVKAQNNYQQLGYDKIIILHTPEKADPQVVNLNAANNSVAGSGLTQADIERAKAEAREEARKDFEAEQKQKEEDAAADLLKNARSTKNYQFAEKEGFHIDDEKTTIPQIHAFAEKHKIEFSADSSVKADFVADVKKWLEQETAAE